MQRLTARQVVESAPRRAVEEGQLKKEPVCVSNERCSHCQDRSNLLNTATLTTLKYERTFLLLTYILHS